jgi:transposase-like protein
VDIQEAYKLFKNVLESFHDSEMMVIDERSTDPSDIDELKKNCKELDEEMKKYLGLIKD